MWKPPLTATALERAGFQKVSAWVLADGQLALTTPLPSEPGVYAFVVSERAMYVGLAASGLSNRCKFYMRPGATQRTSIRLNATMFRLLAESGGSIEVYVAQPDEMSWNGLPVSVLAGLEAGMIKAFDLPWNLRGV